MRSVRFDSASAGSAIAMSNTSALPNPAAAVATQTAAAAAGRDRLTSAHSDTANTARSIAGSKVLDCFSTDGKQTGVPSSRSASSPSTDVGAVATPIDEPLKTVIRNVVIPRSDPANPASSFKLDVRCLLQLLFAKHVAEDKAWLNFSYFLSSRSD